MNKTQLGGTRQSGRASLAGAAIFLLACALSLAAVAVRTPPPAAPPAGRPPLARVGTAHETPNIDGRLKERCWANAEPLTDFFDIKEGAPAEPKTRVQVLTRGRWLYVAATCDSKDINQALAERRRRDSDVFNDDSFEVLIDPVGYHARVYRFVINSIGTRLDEVIPFDGRGVGHGRPCWLGRARRSRPPEPGRWTAEIAIDLASLDVGPNNAGRWRANFIRHVRQPGRSDSAWARPRFWRFGCDKPRMGVLTGIATRQIATGCTLRVIKSDVQRIKGVLEGRVEVSVTNEMTRKRTFDLMLRTPTRWMDTRRVEVDGRSRLTVGFPFEMALAEEPELKIEAIDVERRQPAAAIAHVFSPRLPVEARFDRSYYTTEKTASFRVDIEGRKPAAGSVRLRLFDSGSGKELWKVSPAVGQARSGGYGATVEVPLAGLPPGGYLMETVYDDPAQGQRYRCWSSLRKLADRAGGVKVDSAGFFLRGGRPFYPIEVRRVSGSPAETYEKIRTQTAFNINWGWYVRYRGNVNYAVNLYKATGCLCDINIDDLYYQRGPARDDIIGLIRQYTRLPFMFSYGMESLPGEESYSTEPAATVQRYMQTIDPYHPFYVVLGDASQARRFRNCADYLVVRCRAIAPGGIGEPEWVYEHVRRARKGAGPHVPVVALIPAYRDRERSIERPSMQQVFAMTYLALAAGAAGVIFDGFHYRVREDPLKRGFWDDPQLREMIFALTQHLAFLGPIVISPDASESLTVDQPQYGSVRWTARRYSGKLYVIAVNASTRKAYAAFRPAHAGRFTAVRDVLAKRDVAVDGARFTAEFGPYEAHVFEIEEKQ